ncbi:hypothetical protein Tco_1471094 [Tanacetum coccineum]
MLKHITLRLCCYLAEIIVVNLDSSSDNNSDSYSTSEDIDYDSPKPPKSLLKWYYYLSDEYKDNGRFWGSKSGCNESDVKPSLKDIEKAKAYMLAKAQAELGLVVHLICRVSRLRGAWFTLCVLLADLWVTIMNFFLAELIMISDSSDDSNCPSIPRVPIYGPSVQGFLDYYGYENIEDYLFYFYFPSTNKEDTIVHTGQEPIHECHSLISKAKYVRVLHKHNLNFKSPTPIKRCMLGLPNVDTWDDILKNFGMKKPRRCTNKLINDSSNDNKGVSSKGPSITSILKEGPSIARLSKEPIPKELLEWYGYDIVEDLPVAKKPIPKVIFKSPTLIKECVLGLANVET